MERPIRMVMVGDIALDVAMKRAIEEPARDVVALLLEVGIRVLGL